jgi:hypothetical protein
MKFIDYLAQEDPKLNIMVPIYKEDCYHIFPAPSPYRYIIQLRIKGDIFQYLVTHTNNILFTMDEDGNKKACSCFVWKGDSEE